MRTRKVEILDLHNVLAGLAPIDGVALLAGGSIRIDFTPAATLGQREAATTAAADWSWDAEVAADPTVEERLEEMTREIAALKKRP